MRGVPLNHAREYVKSFRRDKSYNDLITDIRIIEVTKRVVE